MEDRLRKAQREMSDAANVMMSEWLNRVLQGISNDPVMGQLWSAMHLENKAKPQSMVDPYRILGLDRAVADDQVKKRYRELAVKLHPDTAGMSGTEFMFQLITAAYQQIAKERGW